MSAVDFQHFQANGIWIKPPGARTVDVILTGADGAASVTITEDGVDVLPGSPGEIKMHSCQADDLPDEVAVEVGRGGRSSGFGGERRNGADGMVVVITHLGA